MNCVKEEMVELPPTNRNGIRGPLLRFHRGCELKMLSIWIGLTTLFLWNLEESLALNTAVDLDYCSHDVSARTIPPLADSLKDFDPSMSIDDVNMLQIQVFVRHGARTVARRDCWENYNETWNCSSTNLIRPSNQTNDFAEDQTPLFRMKYGDGGLGTETVLNGTCQWGQLTDEGYDQMRRNGEILRNTYICTGSSCLLESNKVEDLENVHEDLWLCSDDMPRTVMSGQVLTKTLFDTTTGGGSDWNGDTILEWHTGDKKIDKMFDLGDSSPRMLDAKWRNSKSYKDKINSKEAKILKDKIIMEWGNKEVWEMYPEDIVYEHLMDCVMSSECTERELPRATGPDTASEIADMAMWYRVSFNFYNSSQLPKTHFLSLFTKIRDFTTTMSLKYLPPDRAAPKFVLFAFHDMSIMALLSVFAPNEWDRKWPPYASMVVLELMRINGDGIYFRLVYNGKVLKPAGCEKDIFQYSVFESITNFVNHPEVS